MSQRLILPLNTARVTAGYKMPIYNKQYGYAHYGCDYNDVTVGLTQKAYGMGNGLVTHCGWDSRCGNVICLVYKNVELHDGTVLDIACRLYHLSSIAVRKGQAVNRDTYLGNIGNTGMVSSGVHLHVEFDRDSSYPNYTPQIGGNGTILRKAVAVGSQPADTTIDPSTVFWLGNGQSLIPTNYAGGWVAQKDFNLPAADGVPEYDGSAALKRALDDALNQIDELKAEISRYKQRMQEIAAIATK